MPMDVSRRMMLAGAAALPLSEAARRPCPDGAGR